MKIITKNKNIVKRNIHDSFFLIDITQNYLDEVCSIYELNEMGSYIWDLLDSNNTIEDIAKKILDILIDDIEPEVIHADVSQFIEQMASERFVEITDGRA